ncbi:MAG: DUF4221 domain-containing protein [Tannerellaceae bacterium]|nr:DUF4221 domain-containing protein [Tannerellaceae bacterium]
MITISLLLCAFFSCRRADEATSYRLVRSDKTLSFPLDDRMKSSLFSYSLYTDKEGKEYFTVKNPDTNDILFYNMATSKPEFKRSFAREGNHGVGRMDGYHIHTFDSIFLISNVQMIVLADTSTVVKDRFHYETTSQGIPLLRFPGLNSMSQPLVILDNKLHILPIPNRRQEINPLCVLIDLADKSVLGLKVQYPEFPGMDDGTYKTFGSEIEVSRCYDGRQFVYSFYYDEDIYIVDIGHTSLRKVKAVSRYIDRVEYPDDFVATPEEICTNPKYGSLLYDKYRDVYYRIAYPKSELEKGVNALELIQFGCKLFSIMILDREWNVVGETKLPEYTYNSRVWFVREDGLYLSASHFMNPEYSDDWLVFHRFDLVKKKE